MNKTKDCRSFDSSESAFCSQEFFPQRNYNRAIKPLTEYFADKFDILPESTKKFFLHVASAADAAAKPTEQHIELRAADWQQLLLAAYQELKQIGFFLI